METGVIILLVIGGLILVIGVVIVLILAKKQEKFSAEEFQRQKNLLKPHCSEEEYKTFMEFLFRYQGGYARRRKDGSTIRGYLGKEKGDLKGVFFHVILPNPNLHSYQKEEFRQFARSVGVNGLDERPDYETRDSRLKNTETDTNSFRRKEVGNIGEQIIRDILRELESYQYAVINGAKLKADGAVHEYDHIVIGRGGIFVIETKAFGMTDGKNAKASLFIDEGDHWILRKNQINHELVSPTEQIMTEKEHFSKIISDVMFEVHPIVVLSNTEISLKQNIDLPYQVVCADKLVETIRSYHDRLTDNDVRLIVHATDESRVN